MDNLHAKNIPTFPQLGTTAPQRLSIASNATLIYTHKFFDQVYIFKTEDKGNGRQGYGFMVVTTDGRMSRPVYVTRRELVTKKHALDFLFDSLTGFSYDDISKVLNKAREYMNENNNGLDFSESLSPEEMYLSLCEYCEAPPKETEAYIEIEDGYCNIHTPQFDGIIKQLECGYKKLEVLRELKLMKRLHHNDDRAYDYKIQDKNGFSYRVYRIEFLDESSREAYRNAYLKT